MQKKEKNILAIIGFVLAFIFPVAGIVVSAIASSKAKNGEYETDYAGFAKAGLIISIIALVVEAIAIVAAISVVGSAASTANDLMNDALNRMLIK